MKFQNPSLNSVLNGRTDERTNGRTDERTSRNQYAPHFFKVGGIIMLNMLLHKNKYNADFSHSYRVYILRGRQKQYS